MTDERFIGRGQRPRPGADAGRSTSRTDLLAAKGLDGGEASNPLAWQRTLDFFNKNLRG